MEQSDLNLLHTVPLHHLQTLIKSRRLPLSPKGPQVNTSAEPSSITITEIAQYLFNPSALDEVLGGLGEKETLILHELVACGGRANSRDLALYLTSSGLLNADKEAEPSSWHCVTCYYLACCSGASKQTLVVVTTPVASTMGY